MWRESPERSLARIGESGGVEFAAAGVAAQSEREIAVGEEIKKNVADALLAANGESPGVETAEQNRARAERERFEDVRAAANAAVEEHGNAAVDLADDGGQRVKAGDRAIDLAATVIRNDQAIDAGVESKRRIVRVQNAFQKNGQAGVLAKKREILPGERSVGEKSGPDLDGSSGILFGRLRQKSAENGIAEIVGDALAENEGKVSVLEVAFAPSEHAGVEGDDERLITCAFGALEHAGREFGIFAPIQLKPQWNVLRFGADLGDFFNGAAGCGAENEGQSKRSSGASGGEFGIGMNDALNADGTEQDGSGKLRAKELDAQIAVRNIAQHARDDAPAIERFAVGADSIFATGATGDIVKCGSREDFAGFLFEKSERDRSGRAIPGEAEHVDLLLAERPGSDCGWFGSFGHARWIIHAGENSPACKGEAHKSAGSGWTKCARRRRMQS